MSGRKKKNEKKDGDKETIIINTYRKLHQSFRDGSLCGYKQASNSDTKIIIGVIYVAANSGICLKFNNNECKLTRRKDVIL